MGCGSCGPCANNQNVVIPMKVAKIQPITTENKLSCLITHYRKVGQSDWHPILKEQELTEVQNWLASNNNLPQLNLIAASALQKGQKVAAQPDDHPTLLNKMERIIWKCFIIIPQFDSHSYCHSKAEFKPNLSPQQQVCPHSFHQISLDVSRTFPTNPHLNRKHLSEVLKNIANFIPGVGYTQGMNFFVGFLLLCGFGAEECFHLMLTLFMSRTYFLVSNFHSTFKQVSVCCELLSKKIPVLAQHIEQFGITEHLYSFSWFLCWFLYTLSPESCVLIWDYMVKNGSEQSSEPGGVCTIINIAVEIMQSQQSKIMEMSSAEQILGTLRGENLRKMIDIPFTKQLIRKVSNKTHGLVIRANLMEQDRDFQAIMTVKAKYQQYMDSVKNIKQTR